MSAPAMSVYPDNDELLPMADPIDSENMVRTKGDRSCNDFGHPQCVLFISFCLCYACLQITKSGHTAVSHYMPHYCMAP